ncbi:MAG: hypothetical protein AABZ60_16175 [Planctomycetota bacterium]
MILRILGYLFLLGGMGSIYFLQEKISPINFEIEKRKVFYLPSSNACKVISLGFYELYADILWIRVTQFYSEKMFDPSRPLKPEERELYYKKIVQCFETITDLDPYYRDVYDIGKSLLLALKGDDEASMKLLKKGYEYNKHDWRYSYDLGVSYLLELKPVFQKYQELKQSELFPAKDPRRTIAWDQEIVRVAQEGIKWFKIAIQYEEIPEVLRYSIVSFLTNEGDVLEDMMQHWIFKLEESAQFDQKEVLHYYQEKFLEMIHLKELRKVINACKAYKKAYKTNPKTLENLRTLLPKDFDWKKIKTKKYKEWEYYEFRYSDIIPGQKRTFNIEIEDIYFIDSETGLVKSERLLTPSIIIQTQSIQSWLEEYQLQNKTDPTPELFREKINQSFVHPIPWKTYNLVDGKIITGAR